MQRTGPTPEKKVCILFSGPCKTAKIIAAVKIARESDLDLFRSDLSLVVSKYIGETEKNLNSIFSEADTGSAILFFDEADALFGKRRPVRGEHDHCAHIEVTCLLRKVEESKRLVILASNYSGSSNNDFRERMDFVVDFP
jgi:SpoVK/Ycf46/Vps4 family AAA+-type ATPase